MQDVLIMGIIFAVPITAIVSWARIKMKRLDVESGVATRELAERLERLERDNAGLQERVGVLETIVTLEERPRTGVRVAPAAVTATGEGDELAAVRAEVRQARR